MRVRVEGATRGTDEPLLYAANHLRAVDALLLSLFLPRNITVVLPGEDLRRRWQP